MSDLPFCRFGNGDGLRGGKNPDRVALAVKADALFRHIIHNDCVQRLRGKFFAGIFQDIFRFCGKTYDDLCLLATRDFAKDVSRRHKFEAQRAPTLDLLIRRIPDGVVGNGGSLDHDGSSGQKT